MQSAINIEKPMAARRSVGSVGQKKVKTFTDELLLNSTAFKLIKIADA